MLFLMGVSSNFSFVSYKSIDDVLLAAGMLEAAGDIEIDQLRRRLVETEAAMERIVLQMGNLSRSVMHCSSPQPESKVHLTFFKRGINVSFLFFFFLLSFTL